MGFETVSERIQGLGSANGGNERIPDRLCCNKERAGTKIIITRMLAINVSIPNLTVARLEQFPSPQMIDNKPSFT